MFIYHSLSVKKFRNLFGSLKTNKLSQTETFVCSDGENMRINKIAMIDPLRFWRLGPLDCFGSYCVRRTWGLLFEGEVPRFAFFYKYSKKLFSILLMKIPQMESLKKTLFLISCSMLEVANKLIF